MSKRLSQEGIFKVQPMSWDIRTANSGAVAINFGFIVREELEDGIWASWDGFDQHIVYGDWWVVKRDGKINQGAVDQLVDSLGWDGNLNAVIGPPPERIVQVSVKGEVYEGVTRYKAQWMNPEDYAGKPGGGGATEQEAQQLQNRFGSLLKAAAAVSRQGAPKEAKAKPASGPRGPQEPDADAPHPGDQLIPCTKCKKMVRVREVHVDLGTCLACDDIPFE